MGGLSEQQIDQLIARAYTGFGYYDVDITQAQNNLELKMAGDFLFIDKSSTGSAMIAFNDQADVPINFGPGDSIETKFVRGYLSCAAQAGKTFRILYAVGDRIRPGANIDTLQQIVQPVTVISTDETISNGWSTGQLTNDSIFHTLVTPAQNVNGLRINGMSGGQVGGMSARLMAKQTPPTGTFDTVAWGLASVYNSFSCVPAPFIIPAGYGLFTQGQSAAGDSYWFDVFGALL